MMCEDIIKLAKKFAMTHRQYSNVYDSIDDYIAELECAAVSGLNSYDDTKGAFSTWCYAVFGNAVIKEIVSQLRQRRDAEVVSLDLSLDDEGNTLSELICDDTISQENIEDKLHKRLIFEAVYPYLSDNFKNHFFNNKTLEEIAIATHTSKQNVNQKLDREIERLRDALNTDNFNLLKRYNNRHHAAQYAKANNVSLNTYYQRRKNGLIEEVEYDIRANL